MSVDCEAKGSFKEFQKLCIDIASDPGRLHKTAAVKAFHEKYDGIREHYGNKNRKKICDLKVLLNLLLPKATKRVYHMSDKKMWKMFASIFGMEEEALSDEYTKGTYAGDVGAVIKQAYKANEKKLGNSSNSSKDSVLSMKEVDSYLDKLTALTKHDEQMKMLTEVTQQCTPNDLCWFVRQLDKDLRIDAGNRTILDGIHPTAYEAFVTRSSFDYIVEKMKLGGQLTISAGLMTPLKPMLANACKSYEEAFTKCKSGVIFAEIKYDGERVQVHWNGKEWLFYSRSLKPVVDKKIEHVKEAVNKSCPNATSIILDSEIIMVDETTGEPLPFGSLGVHKRLKFDSAQCCLFVFDVLYFNGESLLNKPLKERRELLEKEFTPISNRIHLSQLHKVANKEELEALMNSMINKNLEGLVLKDSLSVYEPNKRHWLKMKRDYLDSGEMAEAADLVVLGAYKGSGKHGGLYSTFLTGVLDSNLQQFKTVCKVHNGLDDEQLKTFTNTLDMVEFNQDECPLWLDVTRTLEPDWIVRNPKKSPVFEVTGFDYSESQVHSATDEKGNRVSIRFPRVTKIRTEKNYKTATTLQELRHLIKSSRENLQKNSSKHSLKRKTMEECSDEDKADCVTASKKRKASSPDNKGSSVVSKSLVNNNSNVINSNSNGNNNHNHNNDNKANVLAITESKTELAVSVKEEPKEDNSSAAQEITKTVDTRPICPYDATCYREKAEHFGIYQHPVRQTKKINEVSQKYEEKKKQVEKDINELTDKEKSDHNKKLVELNNSYNQSVEGIKQKKEKMLLQLKSEMESQIQKIIKDHNP
ncbi:hypothetical protein RFI_25015 [Reticulomyxa filosa]|uniref:DNA ligase n=1 Tax=Reticulomyxa filosa TaxID=46433 RepID=X6MH50_RETFI|nr:hypothetical protein RFI_25015 [Reticulomyxa filosa]|eukprot:ETO12360.1 hypothetical protein RFI_25015 [Reticulomyxa filosa]